MIFTFPIIPMPETIQKMADYAQKILALDPDNFTAALHLARAESQMGNAAGVFDAGEKLSGIINRYNAQTPPAGADAADWTSLHQQSLADQQDQIRYVQYFMTNALYKVQAPADRAAFAERYIALFPDSSFTTYCSKISPRPPIRKHKIFPRWLSPPKKP